MLAPQPNPPDADLRAHPLEDLHAASVHLEDLEIFVGQRSRMHPGPGWAVALGLIRRDLADVRAEMASRAATGRFGATTDVVPYDLTRPATPADPAP